MRTTRSRWHRFARVCAATLVIAATGLTATAASGHAEQSAGTSPTGELGDLVEAWRATAPFHDVSKALAAGWSEQPMCMDYPDGYLGEPPGTMGNHYFNVAYLTDGGRIDPAEPELLLYERQANGRWRLNAVEYIIPARDLPSTAPAPELFGHKFVFHPELGAAGIWGLHAWLWRPNPHGLYAELNPLVSCEHAEHHH